MTTVLAALDNSLATNPVLVGGRSVARVLGSRIHAVYAAAAPEDAVRSAAAGAGVPLRVLTGPVVERLVEAGSDDDVVAMVIGARSKPYGRRPLGSTAFAVATSLPKPVVVVPPDARVAPRLRRILVPLEGTTSTSLAPRSIVELALGAEIEVIALHVHGEDEIPALTDQAQHGDDAWTREFLARYCPWGIGAVQLERRVGRTDELVPLIAEQLHCDLVALGWAQQLGPGRAPVVRSALERAGVPVMLVPVRVSTEVEAVSPGTGKEYAQHGHS